MARFVSLPRPAAEPSDFEAIFERHFSYVWLAFARLGIERADREDLTQEVFFQVYRQLPTADLGLPLRPWLFAFAFRMASSHRRLARNRLEQSWEGCDPVDDGFRADELIERRQAQALVARGLAALDLEQRAVLVLHDLDDCSIPEVATALGIPLNTAYSRLRLARTRFAAAVRRITLQQGAR